MQVAGWRWDAYKDQWREQYQRLLAYVERHGRQPNCASGSLGTWVSNQRHLQKAGRLTQERAGLLDAVPGWQWQVYRRLGKKTGGGGGKRKQLAPR